MPDEQVGLQRLAQPLGAEVVAHVGVAHRAGMPAARHAAASSAALGTHQPWPCASTVLARMPCGRQVDAVGVVAEAVAHGERTARRHVRGRRRPRRVGGRRRRPRGGRCRAMRWERARRRRAARDPCAQCAATAKASLSRRRKRQAIRSVPRPSARSSSCRRSTLRCTLPVVVIGRASMNSISFGYS